MNRVREILSANQALNSLSAKDSESSDDFDDEVSEGSAYEKSESGVSGLRNMLFATSVFNDEKKTYTAAAEDDDDEESVRGYLFVDSKDDDLDVDLSEKCTQISLGER